MPFVVRSPVCTSFVRSLATLLVAIVSALLAATGAFAQTEMPVVTTGPSVVSIYGVVDAAIRRTTNEQAPGGAPVDKTQMVGGGMSQSRFGFAISEDLGGGNRALANLEHRLLLDTGTQAGTEFWQQSWVGLQTAYGRVTLGRQYSVLFDVYTSTYPSFKYSPYIEYYKPELGFSLGARNNNMVKYAAELGGLQAELQASPSEGSALGGKSYGGLVRYTINEFSFGGAYLELADGSGLRAKATTLGGSWSSGPWYVAASFARNTFATGFNPQLILAYLSSSTTNGMYGPNIDHRDGYSLGATYQLTPALNLGGHFWHIKQAGVTTAGSGDGNFVAVVADYALSKRTDAYVEFDHTKFGGAMTYPNGADTRTGFMIGFRNRF
jgi:predicted porin